MENQLEELLDKYYSWDEESLGVVKELLSTNKKIAKKLIEKLESDVYGLKDKSLIPEIFEILRTYHEEAAIELAVQNDFFISNNDVLWVLNHPDFNDFRIKNNLIKEERDRVLLADEDKFIEAFGHLDGQGAIKTIPRYSKKIGIKIFNYHKDAILKRFGVAGQEESKCIREIIELGVLDEKQMKRATKRMIKEASREIPLQSVIESGFFSEEEIIEIAREKGIEYLASEPSLPEYLGNFFVEEEEESNTLGKAIENKLLNKEQTRAALKKMNTESLVSIFPSIPEDERDGVLKRILESSDFFSDSQEITQLGNYSKEAALHCINESIKRNPYLMESLLDVPFIKPEQIFKIFEAAPKSVSIRIAKNNLEQLKTAGLDKQFAELALEKCNKKDLNQLALLLQEYIPEEKKIELEENYVKSVDGAKDYILNQGKNYKVRMKAIARISNSADALNSILVKNPNSITDEEVEKIFSYAKAKEILLTEKTILNAAMSRLSKKTINEIYNHESLLIWPVEFLVKIDSKKIKESTIHFIQTNPDKLYSLIQIPLILVAETIIENSNEKLKTIILGSPKTFAAKHYISKLKGKNKDIPPKLQFLYKDKVNQTDYKNAEKYLLKGEETYPMAYINENFNDFISKWTPEQQESLIFILLYRRWRFKFGKLSIVENRDSFLNALYASFQKYGQFILEENSEYHFEVLTDEEAENIYEIIRSNPQMIEYVASNWSEEGLQKVFTSFDEIVSMILNGSISPNQVPKAIAESLSLQAVRERNPELITLIYSSAGIEILLDKVSSQEEAKELFRVVVPFEDFSSDPSRGSSIKQVFFDRFPQYDFRKEISNFILSVMRSYSPHRSRPSELVEKYEGRFELELVEDILFSGLRAKNGMAETKRLIDVFLKQGLEREVFAAVIQDKESFEEILPRSLINKAYTPEVLDQIIKGKPTEKEIVLVLSADNVWDSTKDEAINLAIDFKYLTISQEGSYFFGSIGRMDVFTYDIDSFELKMKVGTESNKAKILDFLKFYIDLINISGIIDLHTKIITTDKNETIDLNKYLVTYDAEDEEDLSQIYGLINFGVPVKARARLFLSNRGHITCRIQLLKEKKKKVESSEILNKLSAKIEQMSEQLESDFVKILGAINKEAPFGIEMEFASKIKRETLASKLNEAHNEGLISGDFKAVSINQYTATVGSDWEIKMDSSIKVESREFSAEVVSPKLYGEEGLKQLEEVVSALVKISTRGTLKTGVEYNCGLHVHHDISEILKHTDNLEDIAKAFYAIQDPLYSICHRQRSSNTYCGKLFFNENSFNYTHRGGFNLTTGKGTIEFRMREGNIDPKAIVRWVRLTKAIVDKVRDMYRDNTIKMKQSIRENFSNIMEAIITEKALQIKEDKGVHYMNEKETYEALMMSSLLLGAA